MDGCGIDIDKEYIITPQLEIPLRLYHDKREGKTSFVASTSSALIQNQKLETSEQETENSEGVGEIIMKNLGKDNKSGSNHNRIKSFFNWRKGKSKGR